MAEEAQPYMFITHTSEVSHTLVIGQTGSGKTVYAEFEKLRQAEHPAGSSAIAPTDEIEGE